MDLEEGEEGEVILAPQAPLGFGTGASRDHGASVTLTGATVPEPPPSFERPLPPRASPHGSPGVPPPPRWPLNQGQGGGRTPAQPPSALAAQAAYGDGGRSREPGSGGAAWHGRDREFGGTGAAGVRGPRGHAGSGGAGAAAGVDGSPPPLRRGPPSFAAAAPSSSASAASSPHSPKRPPPPFGQQPAWERAPPVARGVGPGSAAAGRPRGQPAPLSSLAPPSRRPSDPPPPRDGAPPPASRDAAPARHAPPPQFSRSDLATGVGGGLLRPPPSMGHVTAAPGMSSALSSSSGGGGGGAQVSGGPGVGGGSVGRSLPLHPQQSQHHRQQQQQQQQQQHRTPPIPSSPGARADGAGLRAPAPPDHPMAALSPPTPARSALSAERVDLQRGDGGRGGDDRRPLQPRGGGGSAGGGGSRLGGGVSDAPESARQQQQHQQQYRPPVSGRPNAPGGYDAPIGPGLRAPVTRTLLQPPPQQQMRASDPRQPNDAVSSGGIRSGPASKPPTHALLGAPVARPSSGLLGSAPPTAAAAQRSGLLSAPVAPRVDRASGAGDGATGGGPPLWHGLQRPGAGGANTGSQRPSILPPPLQQQAQQQRSRGILEGSAQSLHQGRPPMSLLGRGDGSSGGGSQPLLQQQQQQQSAGWPGAFPQSSGLLRSGASAGYDSLSSHMPRPGGVDALGPPRMLMGGGNSVLGRFPGPALLGSPPEISGRSGILGRPPPLLRADKQQNWGAPSAQHPPAPPWSSQSTRQHHLMMQQPYDPFGHLVTQQQPQQHLLQHQLYPQQPGIGRLGEQSLEGGIGDSAPDELPLLPEGEAGAAGQALRLEADDGESVESAAEVSDDDEPDAAARVEGSKRRAKRLGLAARSDDGDVLAAVALPKQPPVIAPVGDGSFIPARFVSMLGPLLESIASPAPAPAGILSSMSPFPTLRSSSAPPLTPSGGLSSAGGSVDAPPVHVGIAAAVLADAGVDISVASAAPAPAPSPLPASVTKDRIIAAMEALEGFGARAVEGVSAVEAIAPELRSRALELRAAYDRQQLAASEKRQRQMAAAAAAAAVAAAAAASAAEVAQSAATASASKLPIPVYVASDLLLGEAGAGSAALSSVVARQLPQTSDAALRAACHLLSLLSSWSLLPVWTAQLIGASSVAAEHAASRSQSEAVIGLQLGTRAELVGDAVFSGRVWRLLASALSSASSSGDEIRLTLTPAVVAAPESAPGARGSGLAIRIHRSLPAHLLLHPSDPVVASQLPSFRTPDAVCPAYFLCGLPDAFPASVAVLAFPPSSVCSATLYATIAQSEGDLSICAAIDGPLSVLPPTARRKKAEAVAVFESAASPAVTKVTLPVDSLLAHRDAWARAVSRRRDVLVGNRARAWLSQAEQTRIPPPAYSGLAGETGTALEPVQWAARLQRDGDEFIVPTPKAARVGKPAARVRELIDSAGVVLAPRMRAVVVSALRAKLRSLRSTADGDADQESSAMDWDATADGAGAPGSGGAVLALDPMLASYERAIALAARDRRSRHSVVSPETALLAWRACPSVGALPFFVADGDDALLELLASPAMQPAADRPPPSVVFVVLRVAVERLVHLHVRSHIESALLIRRAALRAQQKAAAVAYVAAYREWKAKRLRQARARRLRIQNAHTRLSAEHFGAGGGGHAPATSAATVAPRFAAERSGGRRAAALVAAVAIASTGATSAVGTSDGLVKPVVPTAAAPQDAAAAASRRRVPPQPSAHTARLDSLTSIQEDLASDSGDDAFLSRFGAGGDVVRSELELQLRLTEIAERERRLEFRLCSLCAVPDRLPEPRMRGFWTRVHYAACSRLTTDGAPPLCASLPAGVPCGAIRPSALQLARVMATFVDGTGSGRSSRPLLLGSADDAGVMRTLETEAAVSLVGRLRPADANSAASTAVVFAETEARDVGFGPSATDNVPPPRRRLWMGSCNCAVAVEIERRAVNPWSDAEKLIFMDKFLQFPKDFPKIASFLPNKSAGECVAFYYDTKHVAGYKHRLKAVNAAQRRRGPRNQWLQACGAARDIGVPLHLDVVRGYSAAGRIISAVGRSSDLAFSRLFIHPGPYARVHALHRFATLPLPLNPPSRGPGVAGVGAASGTSDGLDAAVLSGADPLGRRNEFLLSYGTGVSSLPWGTRFGVVAAAADRVSADPGSIDTLALIPSATAAAAGAGAGVGASLVRVYTGADALTRAESGRGGASGSSPMATSSLTGVHSLRHAAWTGIFTHDRPSELVPPSATPLAWTILGGVGSGPGASTAAFFPLSPATAAALAAAVLLAAVAAVSPSALIGAGLEPAWEDTSSDSDESDDESEDEGGSSSVSRRAEQAIALKRLASILCGGPPPDVADGLLANSGARSRGASATRGGARAPSRRGGGASSRGGSAGAAAVAPAAQGPPRWSRGLVKAWLSLLAKCLPLALLPASVGNDPRATGFVWHLLSGALSSGKDLPCAVGPGRLPAALREFYAEAAGAVAHVVSSTSASCGSHLAATTQLAGAVLPALAVGASGYCVAEGHPALRDLAVSLILSASEACLARRAPSMSPAPSPRPFSSSAPPQSPLPTKGTSNSGFAAVPMTPTSARPDAASLVAAASAALADRSTDVLTAYAANIAIREAPAPPPVAVRGTSAAAAASSSAAKVSTASVRADLLASSVGPFVAPLLQAAAVPPPISSTVATASATPRAVAGAAPSTAPCPAWLPPTTVTLRYFDPLRAMHTAIGPGDIAGVPTAQVSAAFPRRAVESFVVPPTAAEDFVRRRIPALAHAFSVRGSDAEDDTGDSGGAALPGGSSRGKKALRLGEAAAAATVPILPAPSLSLSSLLNALLHLPPDVVLPKHYVIDQGAVQLRNRGYADSAETLPDPAAMLGSQSGVHASAAQRSGMPGGKKRSAQPPPAVKDQLQSDSGIVSSGGAVPVAQAAILPAVETTAEHDAAADSGAASSAAGLASSSAGVVQAVARWLPEERDAFLAGLRVHGRNWQQLQTVLPCKTPLQIRNYFQNNRVRLGLDAHVSQAESSAAVGSEGARASASLSDGEASDSEDARAAPADQESEQAAEDADAADEPRSLAADAAAVAAIEDVGLNADSSDEDFGVDDYADGDGNGGDVDPSDDVEEGDSVAPAAEQDRQLSPPEDCEGSLEPPAPSAGEEEFVEDEDGEYPYEDREEAGDCGGGDMVDHVHEVPSAAGQKRRRAFSSAEEEGGDSAPGSGDDIEHHPGSAAAGVADAAYEEEVAYEDGFYGEEGGVFEQPDRQQHDSASAYDDVDADGYGMQPPPAAAGGFPEDEGSDDYDDAQEGGEAYDGEPAEEGADLTAAGVVPEALRVVAQQAAAAGRGAGFGLAPYAPGPGVGDDDASS